MDYAALIIGTYVVTLTLINSDGPYGALYKLKTYKAVDDFGLLNCFLCTAFWVATGLTLLFFGTDFVAYFIAWGGAVIINRVVQ